MSIAGLLPNAASLNTRDVRQSYDSVPVAPGDFGQDPETTEEPEATQPTDGG